MTDWAAFVGFAGVVLAFLLLLAHASQSAVDPDEWVDAGADAPADATDRPHRPPSERERARRDPTAGADPEAEAETDGRTDSGIDAGSESPSTDAIPGSDADSDLDPTSLSTGTLLVNVALSQGLLGALLVGGALYTGVPASALGVVPATAGATAVVTGVGLGVSLYAANRVGAAAGERVGLAGSDALREALAPTSAMGWVALLGVVLPVIAVFEELLFRGALIGALSVGFGVSPWLLAVGSSVAFALGHGAQGRVGIAVSGVLGFALAAGFVLTGSLLAVVIAHYLVNALEFVIHEGIDQARDRRGSR